MLPRYLVKDGVVAVGEIGYDAMTPDEDEALAAQLELAHRARPARARPHAAPRQGRRHAPHHRRASGVRAPARAVLLDHNNELTVGMVLDSGCWVGFSIYPNTKMDEDRMVADPRGVRAPSG